MGDTPQPFLTSTPPAPRTTHVALIAVPAPPDNVDLALSGKFLTGIGQIDRDVLQEFLVEQIEGAFTDYQSAAADSIRVDLVADGPKLRSAKSIAMRSLGPAKRRQNLNLQATARKKRSIDDTHKHHDELDSLCWLPNGVVLKSISYLAALLT
ncbi:hypothetical protein ColLi_09231 [Colletotrichum liriopes]|uniref:Uncharacterized protein n=1 Tax=Colletotrichum liriopes TaxID=708192 RepID=A0AA37GUK3_9PEZI|nr:hypothetical protein ColLi_09231 [Colletotrichum liriopes]